MCVASVSKPSTLLCSGLGFVFYIEDFARSDEVKLDAALSRRRHATFHTQPTLHLAMLASASGRIRRVMAPW